MARKSRPPEKQGLAPHHHAAARKLSLLLPAPAAQLRFLETGLGLGELGRAEAFRRGSRKRALQGTEG